ncbi:MAG: hypothetical protein J5710_07460 [Treponema sp.]|nr:hypothetical protein [Treponema sp.]
MKKVFVFAAVLLAAIALFAETSGDVQDQQACGYARRAGSAEVWQKYLEKFPNGICSFEAENEIANLKNRAPKQKFKKTESYSIVEEDSEQVRYYRPYKGFGITLLILGGIALTEVMPITAYFAAVYSDPDDDDYDESKYKDLKNASIAMGVIGGAFILGGIIFTATKRPVPNQNQKIELSNLSVAPTKGGMFTSVGFRF